MEHFLIKLGSYILTPFLVLAGLFSPNPTPIVEEVTPVVFDGVVGAVLPQATGVFETSLAAPISASATSMTLTANAVRGGGSVSGYTCFTVDEGSAQAEVICGTVSATAVTSMTRGISYADGTTEVSANKFAHRRGANIKITDFPILQILKAQNNGDATYPNPITYETGVGPVDSNDLADKEYVLSVVSGGAVSYEKVVIAGNAGETVSAGDLVYLLSSDNEWYKTDADTAATVENVVLGLAQGSGTNGNAVTGGVLIQGISAVQSGLSANTIYYASNTAGGLSSSAGTKEVTIGVAKTTTSIIFAPRYNQQLTEDEQDALAGTSGTPSASNKFVTADGLTATLAANPPVVRTYTASSVGSSTTQFDITNPAGTTFRYTYDGTGTDPVISTTTFPTGAIVTIYGPAGSIETLAKGSGTFTITGSGTNYFEVTNASGTTGTNQTLGTDGVLYVSKTATWTKPAGLKYAVVEVVGGGAGGGAADSGASASAAGSSGGGGGYSKELILAASLGVTETVTIGIGGAGAPTTTAGFSGGTTSFGSHLQATGGVYPSGEAGGAGGVGSGGDINATGQGGDAGWTNGSSGRNKTSGSGGNSFFGGGAPGVGNNADGKNGTAYGGGGSGGAGDNSDDNMGGTGYPGVTIVTEYYQ